MTLTLIERILVALQDGAPRAADRVREESQCAEEDLLELAHRGYVRFRTEEAGDLKVCITPEGLEHLGRAASIR